MICFQTYIFVILNTAGWEGSRCNNSLWFAFKLISLSYWIQHPQDWMSDNFCCDLLSNLYLCHIEYSKIDRRNMERLLWFAFKLISLSYWIQLKVNENNPRQSCDLLSNLYLCHIEYSGSHCRRLYFIVVICFQTYIFVILNTAQTALALLTVSLWFAFKLISLSYWIQQRFRSISSRNSCDLLSNLYLCHIEYS